MDWVNRMNAVAEYIDEHLEGEMDYAALSRIAACPEGLFQRMFATIAGLSLSEYIRRRKLTRAAMQLSLTDIKVIELALMYGYESVDAFSAAFKRIHGVTPSQARQAEVMLKSYPRLTFTLSIKGEQEMQYKIVEKDAFQVFGKTLYGIQPSEDNPIPAKWGEYYVDGTCDELIALAEDAKLLGVCYDNTVHGAAINYMFAARAGSEIPSGYDVLDIAASTWVVFESIGAMPHALLKVWERIFAEFLP